MNNAKEIRKRKNSHDFLGKLSGLEEEDKDLLTLFLSCPRHLSPPPPPLPLPLEQAFSQWSLPPPPPPWPLPLSRSHSLYTQPPPLPPPPPPPPPPTPSTSATYHSAPPRGRPWPISFCEQENNAKPIIKHNDFIIMLM
ncbi:hypothetical protein HYC85_009580 [Camellia sinensis]|uniref:Uncharacterized protein n=1 Tax=Camellia sinensis TaxID=4442 RepID=A0A7J7HI86_CAMSI|nr:hypothetical protein HYC85_009580 [Camellia sinensis]